MRLLTAQLICAFVYALAKIWFSDEVCLRAMAFSVSLYKTDNLYLDFRQKTCDRVSAEKGYHFIPPYDHKDVITGQVSESTQSLVTEYSAEKGYLFFFFFFFFFF